MTLYKCVITMMLPDYAPAIIASLIDKGCAVEGGWKTGYIQASRRAEAAAIMYVWIRKDAELNVVEKDMLTALDNSKAQYYSAVIVPNDAHVPFRILRGNIQLPEPAPSPIGAIQ